MRRPEMSFYTAWILSSVFKYFLRFRGFLRKKWEDTNQIGEFCEFCDHFFGERILPNLTKFNYFLLVDSQDSWDLVWHCPRTILRAHFQNWEEQFWRILWVHQNSLPDQRRPNNIDLTEYFHHRPFEMDFANKILLAENL